jgi:dihydrofolate reductase
MRLEALLLGRKTYEGFADAWPQRDGEFADSFNSMPKYVVSSTLKDPDWTNTTVLEATSASRSRSCATSSTATIVVHGSAQLVQGLIENGLVDELRLMVFPVVLGERQAPVRRDERQAIAEAHRLEGRGRRRGDPDVRAGLLEKPKPRPGQRATFTRSGGTRAP